MVIKNGYKVILVSYILAVFLPCFCGRVHVYIRYTPSSHVEKRLNLYDPVGSVYYIYCMTARGFLASAVCAVGIMLNTGIAVLILVWVQYCRMNYYKLQKYRKKWRYCGG